MNRIPFSAASLALAGSLMALLYAAAPPSGADEIPLPAPIEPEEALSGRDIYARVLENRFPSYRQTARLTSGDRAGNEQESVFRMWFREEASAPEDGDQEIASRTLVKYLEPFELRHTGYLILNKRDKPDDQFIYLASERRIRRVNLRGEPIFGSDFSFEDVLPAEIDDFDYTRLPDETIEGISVFVIEALPREKTNSEYSKLRLYIEKDRALPLATRYWNQRELETKALRVDRSSIERIDRYWVARRMTMKSLKLRSFTRMDVEEITPGIDLNAKSFEMRRLLGH